MFAKKTLTATVAALTLAGATVTTSSQAEAGGLRKALAIGILGTAAIGAIAGAASARAQEEADREAYYPRRGYGYEGGYRQVRAYDVGYGGCGFRNSPIFDEYGNRIGSRRVRAC